MSFRVLAISGSLRAASSNTGLVRMAERLVAADSSLDIVVESDFRIESLPFYDADLEDPASTPDVVRTWRSRIQTCDGLLIASPEYNFGPTAVLKNAIDWASRPPGQHALTGKSISLMSSSASTGGKHMVEQLSRVLTLLGNTLVENPAMFVKGAERISVNGTTSDPGVERAVVSQLGALSALMRSA